MANRIVLNETSYHGRGAIENVALEAIARVGESGSAFYSTIDYGCIRVRFVNGEVGKIANARVVVSKRVKESEDTTAYVNPIVKINFDTETEEATSALTIFLKKGVAVETDRDIDKQVNMIRASEHYVVALTDESKVVLAKFKK